MCICCNGTAMICFLMMKHFHYKIINFEISANNKFVQRISNFILEKRKNDEIYNPFIKISNFKRISFHFILFCVNKAAPCKFTPYFYITRINHSYVCVQGNADHRRKPNSSYSDDPRS